MTKSGRVGALSMLLQRGRWIGFSQLERSAIVAGSR
jgi:hypothetical protein